jgi:hypothetical protein
MPPLKTGPTRFSHVVAARLPRREAAAVERLARRAGVRPGTWLRMVIYDRLRGEPATGPVDLRSS